MADAKRPMPKSGGKTIKRGSSPLLKPGARAEIEDLLGDFSEQTGSLFG